MQSCFTIAVGKNGLVRRVTRQMAELRRSKKITQDALAEILEIPVQHVRRIEAGQNITLETMERVAIALGVSVSVIFEPDAEGPKKPPPSRRQETKAKKQQK